MKTFLTALGWGRIAALLGCGLLLSMAFFFKFMVPGYSFTSLVCLLLVALILFYAFFPLLGTRWPKFTKLTMRLCTLILAIGLLIVGVTEAIIIRHSFGSGSFGCNCFPGSIFFPSVACAPCNQSCYQQHANQQRTLKYHRSCCGRCAEGDRHPQ